VEIKSDSRRHCYYVQRAKGHRPHSENEWKEYGQALKKEKWGMRNVMRLRSEMMASVSPGSRPERPFATLSAGRSSSLEKL